MQDDKAIDNYLAAKKLIGNDDVSKRAYANNIEICLTDDTIRLKDDTYMYLEVKKDDWDDIKKTVDMLLNIK